MPAIRAVFYGRKSNEDDGGSVEQQREWARAACEKEGVELVREFADQAKAGWDTARRTDFHAMLAFCREQARKRAPIDAIVCWQTNRFSRADSQETSWFIWEFRKVGVARVLTAQRWYDFGRFEDRILHNIEQDASNHKGMIDQTQTAIRGRIDAAGDGRWAGGPIPMGYRGEREEVVVKGRRRSRTRRLVLGPDREVEAVRLIFRLYADTPLGLRGLAQELTRRKVPTQRGRPAWTVSVVKRVLTNPVYLGRTSWNRRATGQFIGVIDCQPVERPADAGKERANDRSQWIEREGRHDAIIDPVTFERCQQKLAGRRGGRRRTRGTFVLAGLLRCAYCGRSMVGRTEMGGRRVYMCGQYNNCGAVSCHYNAVEADALADALLRKLRAAWGDGVNVETILAEVERQDAAEAAGGHRKAETLKRRLRQLDADLAEGIDRLRSIDRALLDGYQQGLKALQAERDQLAAELRRAADEPSRAEELREKAEGALDVLRRLDGATTAEEPDLLRELLAEVVSKVEVWFHHEPRGKRVRCTFARALVWVREDVALLYAMLPGFVKWWNKRPGPDQ
jgi:DNA invertase Pin-like site-specific DNA recombinase